MALFRAKKTDMMTVILHWALFTTLVISLLTGLRIAADDPTALFARSLDAVLLQGNVVLWHVWSAVALTFIVIAYAAFLIRARLQRRVALDPQRRKQLVAGPRDRRLRALNVLLYWAAFLLLAGSIATGLLLYIAPALLPFVLVERTHEILAWTLPAYVLLHVIAQFAAGGLPGLLKILNPRAAYGAAAAVAAGMATAAVAAIVVTDRIATTPLDIARVEAPPVMDGKADDAAWQDAQAVTVDTVRGINSPGVEPVTVRMVHDGEDLYALFQWPDETRSQTHLPLVKTEEGWRVMQHEYYRQDEDTFYEDKFGVMFATSSELAGAGSSHYGAQPIEGRPAAAGRRGLHYTTDGSIVDVWHWKSVRTGSFEMIDDNFFGPPMEVDPEKSRYTGGYTQDPKDAGGYKANWEEFSTSIVTPTHLPATPEVIADFQDMDMDPETGDAETLSMHLSDTIPYSPEADTYPVGTIMPSVLIDGPYEGDRGEVGAHAEWRDGVWTLEARRKLDTGSNKDVALTPHAPVYMWVAVFNHTQTRHSQHLHPVELTLEP